MNRSICILCSSLAAILTACGPSNEPTVYTVPAEEKPPVPTASQSVAPMAPFAGNAGGDMAAQTLPPSAMNQSAGNPTWTVPEHWQPGTASSMRRGSFTVDEGTTALDISVTSFPGDVGGLLANINRWRGQIGLNPIPASELDGQIQSIEIDGKEAIWTAFDNSSNGQATAAVIVENDGNSWFLKMTGKSDVVSRETAAFRQFAQSVCFHNHH